MYPEAECELNHKTAFQLLIATMLSAQTTDVRVNIVTEELFRNYGEADKMAAIEPETLRNIIRSIEFYNSKADNIIKTSNILVEKYDSQVPDNMEDLVELPDPRASAGEDDRVDLLRAGRRVEEVDRLLELAGHVLAAACQHDAKTKQ